MRTIVSISGTARPDSYTAKALALVNAELGERDVSLISVDAVDLDLSFPGAPPTEDAQQLRSHVEAAAGLVIATPEYHGSFCAMTKLIIENLGFPSSLAGKPVALVGVAAGRIGAVKSLEQLRSVCAHTGAIVLPGAVSVAGVRAAFEEDGTCTDAATEDALRGIAGALVDFLDNYVCPKYALESMVRAGETAWTSTV